MTPELNEIFDEIIDTYNYGLGSIQRMDEGMKETLEEIGDQEGVEVANEALDKQQVALRNEFDWQQTKDQDPLKRNGTRETDSKLDRGLSNFLQAVEAYDNLPDGTEKSRLANEILTEVLPGGVFPITSQTFRDQNAAVADLVDRLWADYAEHLEKLNLEEMVAHLEELNTEFGDRLEPIGDHIEYDEVEASYVEAKGAFQRLLVHVMCNHSDDAERLNRILEPYFEQRERVRRYLQRRGTIPEVDPETGEPVEPTDQQTPPENTPGSNQ